MTTNFFKTHFQYTGRCDSQYYNSLRKQIYHIQGDFLNYISKNDSYLLSIYSVSGTWPAVSFDSGKQLYVGDIIPCFSNNETVGDAKKGIAKVPQLVSGSRDGPGLQEASVIALNHEVTLFSAFQLQNQTQFFQSSVICVRLAHNYLNQYAKRSFFKVF